MPPLEFEILYGNIILVHVFIWGVEIEIEIGCKKFMALGLIEENI